MENRWASISMTTGAESWRKTTSTIIASQAYRSGNPEILPNSVKVSILTVPLFPRDTTPCVYELGGFGLLPDIALVLELSNHI